MYFISINLVADEEQHFNQFDTELENILKFGEKYLALQSIERSKNMGAAQAQ
jgi:bacterioferritin